jgi:hypothetical protein
MNKWAVRIMALLMLLAFALVFAHLKATLVKIQQQRQEQRAR